MNTFKRTNNCRNRLIKRESGMFANLTCMTKRITGFITRNRKLLRDDSHGVAAWVAETAVPQLGRKCHQKETK